MYAHSMPSLRNRELCLVLSVTSLCHILTTHALIHLLQLYRSIVLFREITDDNDAVIVDPSKELSSVLVQHDPLVPVSVMRTSSISNMSGHDTKLSSSGKLIRAPLLILMTESRV